LCSPSAQFLPSLPRPLHDCSVHTVQVGPANRAECPRLEGIALINLGDVEDALRELKRAAGSRAAKAITTATAILRSRPFTAVPAAAAA
jgi:hypothetical protein